MEPNIFEEFIRNCMNNTSNSQSNSNSENDENSYAQQGAATEECRNLNSDIPGGFQDLHPQLYIILGEILGNIVANNMPFNVQNSIGNWLQLVGQAILTYNAQQQYFMGGPGRYYSPIYRNVNNPFCPSSQNPGTPENTDDKKKSSNSNSNSNSNINSKKNYKSSTNSTYYEDMNERGKLSKSEYLLKKRIEKLEEELENIRKEIQGLKK